MLKSKLKSLPNDDAHGNVQPMRFLYSCNFAIGARYRRKHDVMIGQVNGEPVEAVRDQDS